jgi:hypothetical protein
MDVVHQVVSMQGGTGYSTYSTPGHSNRIFSLKFYPLDPNMLVSGALRSPPASMPCRAQT